MIINYNDNNLIVMYLQIFLKEVFGTTIEKITPRRKSIAAYYQITTSTPIKVTGIYNVQTYSALALYMAYNYPNEGYPQKWTKDSKGKWSATDYIYTNNLDELVDIIAVNIENLYNNTDVIQIPERVLSYIFNEVVTPISTPEEILRIKEIIYNKDIPREHYLDYTEELTEYVKKIQKEFIKRYSTEKLIDGILDQSNTNVRYTIPTQIDNFELTNYEYVVTPVPTEGTEGGIVPYGSVSKIKKAPLYDNPTKIKSVAAIYKSYNQSSNGIIDNTSKNFEGTSYESKFEQAQLDQEGIPKETVQEIYDTDYIDVHDYDRLNVYGYSNLNQDGLGKVNLYDTPNHYSDMEKNNTQVALLSCNNNQYQYTVPKLKADRIPINPSREHLYVKSGAINYINTQDTYIKPDKDYYIDNQGTLVNPHDLELQEFDGYKITEDSTVDINKNYYEQNEDGSFSLIDFTEKLYILSYNYKITTDNKVRENAAYYIKTSTGYRGITPASLGLWIETPIGNPSKYKSLWETTWHSDSQVGADGYRYYYYDYTNNSYVLINPSELGWYTMSYTHMNFQTIAYVSSPLKSLYIKNGTRYIEANPSELGWCTKTIDITKDTTLQDKPYTIQSSDYNLVNPYNYGLYIRDALSTSTSIRPTTKEDNTLITFLLDDYPPGPDYLYSYDKDPEKLVNVESPLELRLYIKNEEGEYILTNDENFVSGRTYYYKQQTQEVQYVQYINEETTCRELGLSSIYFNDFYIKKTSPGILVNPHELNLKVATISNSTYTLTEDDQFDLQKQYYRKITTTGRYSTEYSPKDLGLYENQGGTIVKSEETRFTQGKDYYSDDQGTNLVNILSPKELGLYERIDTISYKTSNDTYLNKEVIYYSDDKGTIVNPSKLNWYTKKDGILTLTTDDIIDTDKIYYSDTNESYRYLSVNPHDLGWYVKNKEDNSYSITNDKSMGDGSYLYYINMDSVNPKKCNWKEINNTDDYIVTTDTELLPTKQYYTKDPSGAYVLASPVNYGWLEQSPGTLFYQPSQDIQILSGKNYAYALPSIPDVHTYYYNINYQPTIDTEFKEDKLYYSKLDNIYKEVTQRIGNPLSLGLYEETASNIDLDITVFLDNYNIDADDYFKIKENEGLKISLVCENGYITINGSEIYTEYPFKTIVNKSGTDQLSQMLICNVHRNNKDCRIYLKLSWEFNSDRKYQEYISEYYTYQYSRKSLDFKVSISNSDRNSLYVLSEDTSIVEGKTYYKIDSITNEYKQVSNEEIYERTTDTQINAGSILPSKIKLTESSGIVDIISILNDFGINSELIPKYELVIGQDYDNHYHPYFIKNTEDQYTKVPALEEVDSSSYYKKLSQSDMDTSYESRMRTVPQSPTIENTFSSDIGLYRMLISTLNIGNIKIEVSRYNTNPFIIKQQQQIFYAYSSRADYSYQGVTNYDNPKSLGLYEDNEELTHELTHDTEFKKYYYLNDEGNYIELINFDDPRELSLYNYDPSTQQYYLTTDDHYISNNYFRKIGDNFVSTKNSKNLRTPNSLGLYEKYGNDFVLTQDTKFKTYYSHLNFIVIEYQNAPIYSTGSTIIPVRYINEYSPRNLGLRTKNDSGEYILSYDTEFITDKSYYYEERSNIILSYSYDTNNNEKISLPYIHMGAVGIPGTLVKVANINPVDQGWYTYKSVNPIANGWYEKQPVASSALDSAIMNTRSKAIVAYNLVDVLCTTMLENSESGYSELKQAINTLLSPANLYATSKYCRQVYQDPRQTNVAFATYDDSYNLIKTYEGKSLQLGDDELMILQNLANDIRVTLQAGLNAAKDILDSYEPSTEIGEGIKTLMGELLDKYEEQLSKNNDDGLLNNRKILGYRRVETIYPKRDHINYLKVSSMESMLLSTILPIPFYRTGKAIIYNRKEFTKRLSQWSANPSDNNNQYMYINNTLYLGEGYISTFETIGEIVVTYDIPNYEYNELTGDLKIDDIYMEHYFDGSKFQYTGTVIANKNLPEQFKNLKVTGYIDPWTEVILKDYIEEDDINE